MTPQQLKNSLLKLAFEGKLVPQNKNDEPISGFLNNIVCKQKELVSKSIIKVGKFDKNLPSNDELPSGWEYTKIGLLSSLVTKQTGFDYSNVIKPSLVDHKMPNTLPLIQTRNFKGKTFNYESAFYVPDKISSLYPNLILNKKCLLLSIVGSIGNVGYCDPKEIGFLGGAITKIDLIDNTIFDYIYYYLQSPLGYAEINKNEKKTAQATITVEDVRNILIPMPPIKEQKRIVTKIEELLPLVDRYEEAWKKLETFNKKFPIDMEKSILNCALKGKLVPQILSEGNANVKFQNVALGINSNKKLKKRMTIKEVSNDDTPFDIPITWKWCRIADVCNIVNGFTPSRTNELFWKNGDICWMTVEDINEQGKYLTKTNQHITDAAIKSNDRIVPPNSTFLCCTSATIGRVAINKVPMASNQQFNGIIIRDEFKDLLCNEFVYFYCSTLKNKLLEIAGITTFPFVSVSKLGDLPFPLPPLSEQKRIVAKLEELLPICKKLVR